MFRTTAYLTIALACLYTNQSLAQRAICERQAWHLAPCALSDADFMIDPLEASFLDGSFIVPGDGVSVDGRNGKPVAWRYMDIGSNRHSFEVEPGSWLYIPLEDLPEGPALIDISGHERFYINREARSGRPASAGMMKYPVNLSEGANELLILAEKDLVTVKVQPLGESDQKIQFLHYDRVLPWLDDLKDVDVEVSLLLVNAGDSMSDLRVATKTRFEPLNKWADYPDDAVAGVWQYQPVESVPAWSMAKVPMRVIGPPPHKRTGFPYPVDVQLQRASDGEVLAEFVFSLSARQPGNHELRTYRDSLGTVQSYMALPPAASATSSPPAIVALPTTLRSVHKTAYAFEEGPDELVIVPGTRRPGLGTTSIGRSQIGETVEHVRTLHPMNEKQMAIVGYADGGRAAWGMAQRHPGMFSGVVPIGTDVPLQEEASLSANIDGIDVVFRHGEGDTQVDPLMASRMEKSRHDCSGRTLINIESGVDRWWGAATITDDKLYDFLFQNQEKSDQDIETIDLVLDHTTHPHDDHWVVVHQHDDYSHPARLNASRDRDRVEIRTDNVRQLLIRGDLLGASAPLAIDIDGTSLSIDPTNDVHCLHKGSTGWAIVEASDSFGKNHLRNHYEDLFNKPLLMVYGTACSTEAARNNWVKARFDAEKFWRLADGSARLVPDKAVNTEMLEGVNVILYGNADTNSVWSELLADSPINVNKGSVRMGNRNWEGDDLIARFIRPLPGDQSGVVVAIGTSGDIASSVAQQVLVTDPRVNVTDWTIMNSDSLGSAPLAAGEFNRDWKIEP